MPDELPYDPEQPPREPPAGADTALWRLAYLVHEAHRPRVAGLCTCGRAYPCAAAKFADDQLRQACHIGRSGTAEKKRPARQSEPGA